MPRKATTEQTTTPIATEPTVKVEKVKKVKKEVVAEPVAPVPVELPVPAPVEELVASQQSVVDDDLIVKALGQITEGLSALKSAIKVNAKQNAKIKHALDKILLKKSRKGNRTPGGFVIPVQITSELSSFLGLPEGDTIARSAVTRKITDYIKANKLQNPKNGRYIVPDGKLSSLLKLSETDKENLTFFSMQRHLTPHFTKAVKQ